MNFNNLFNSTTRYLQAIEKPIILSWSILCTCVFVYFPGRVSYIYWSNLKDLPLIFEKLTQIDLLNYGINLLQAIAGILIYSTACISLGLFITKATGLDTISNASLFLSKLSQLATCFLLGSGIFSLIFLSLGGLYKLTPPIVASILAIGIISGLNQLKTTFQKMPLPDKLRNNKDKIIFWLSISILLVAPLLSSARMSYDSSAIYFSDAKITAQTEQVQFFTNDTFVASVFHTAIQFTAIIQIFGDQAARLLSLVNGIAILIFSLGLGEKVGLSRDARVILLALLLTSTAFVDLLGDGKVDLISSAPAIAAIYWMIVKSQKQILEKPVFLLIGFFIGLAIIGRPFNAFLLGIVVVLFYFQQTFLSNGFKSSSFNTFVSSVFWIGVGAIGLGIFHLFTNWMILGNPLAFLSSITNINPTAGPWDNNPKQMLALRVFYPLAATFRNTPQSLGNISPLLIAFLPSLFLLDVRKKIKLSKPLINLVVISAITIILWIFIFFTVVELRYVFFLWIIIFIPVAEIISSVLKSEELIFQNFFYGLTILLLGYFVFRTVFIAMDSYSPINQQGSPQCSNFVMCEYLKSINKAAAPGERVLTLSAYRYYLRNDLFVCSTTHEEYQILQKLSHQDTGNFWLEVYRQGYKYISYENEYTTRHLQLGIIPSEKNVPPWIHLEPIYGKLEDPVVAYKINVNNPPNIIQKECRQNGNHMIISDIK